MSTRITPTPTLSYSNTPGVNCHHHAYSLPSRVVCLGFMLLLTWDISQAQNTYFKHNLVSDVPGTADFTDTNLVNAWGIATSTTSPFWLTDERTGLSTLYNSSGTPQTLVVTVPPPGGRTPPSKPTGIVFNSTTNFVVASNAVARFIFDTEDGVIAGWNSGGSAVVKVDNSAAGAVYKGLAIGSSGGGNYLYTANFHSGAIEVYDGNYNRVTLTGSFNDPSLPAGFAPFNIRNLGGQLYVTYAKQDALGTNDVAGPGNGFVNIFDTSGNFVTRFASSNVLNSPWGLAIAPTNFAAFSGAVLVGNFGDGRINAFDSGGSYLGTVQDATGNPIVIPGLWGLIVGNGGSGGDARTLYFAAGISGQSHGLFGSISAIPPLFANTVDKGVAVGLNWVGGTPPFLLQKKVSVLDSNWVNWLTTTNRNPIVAKESATAFFRAQGLTTNTVWPFTALLNGASEVPAVSTSAGGIGAFSLEGSNLSFYVSFSGLSSPATAAHFHAPGNPTNNSAVMIPLSPPAATAGTMSGTLALTLDQLTNFVNGLCYINVHTSVNPGGEIRGQVVPLHMVDVLNAASEVPPVTNAPNATAAVSLSFIGSQLYYSVTYSGLSAPATAWHIHGPADPTTTAPVIVPLATPSGTSGTVSGTATLTPTEMAYLLSGLTYINIHTTNNPGGEIRGQLWPIQLRATLEGASEVPATASPGLGSASMNILNNVLAYTVSFTNLLSPAIAAHIHAPATPSQNSAVIIPFSVPASTAATFSGTATLTSQQLFYLMSGLGYVNVHTTNYGGGEIRGQLVPND